MKEVEFKIHGLFWKQTWIDVVSVTLNVIFVFSQMKLLNLYIKRAQTTTSNSSSSSDISSHSWSHPHHPHHQTLSSTRVSRVRALLEHTREYVLFNHILTLELPSPLTWNKHHFICASVRKPTEEHFPSQSVFTLFLLTVCCCVYRSIRSSARRCVSVIHFCWRNKCHCLMFFCLWWVLEWMKILFKNMQEQKIVFVHDCFIWLMKFHSVTGFVNSFKREFLLMVALVLCLTKCSKLKRINLVLFRTETYAFGLSHVKIPLRNTVILET